MSRVRRTLLWGISLLLFAVIAAAAYFYFVGTRTILEHAEALTHQRLTVSQLADQDAYRFFFVTNRIPDQPDGPVESWFSADRSDALQFGSFDSEIRPTMGLGVIVDTDAWFVNEEIRLNDVRMAAKNDILEELRNQVAASPRQSLLVVVHGFRERFPSALRKAAFLGYILDIDTPILVFDWPGNQGGSLGGYRRARSVAVDSGPDLAETLRTIIHDVEPKRLWLIANSMGGEVVARAFNTLATDESLADAQTEIEDVILTAPDVSREKFNEKFKHDLKALARHTAVYVSSNDRALLASRLINREARLGESSLDPTNPAQIEEAESFSKLLEPGDDRLAMIDVTAINRTRNFHNFSLETPEFFDDLFLRLTSEGFTKSRELYDLETADGRRYFVLTRGR